MRQRKWRLHLDTSVFGGCFDPAEGWAEDSLRLFDAARKGVVTICLSDTVARELERAPEQVKELRNGLPPDCYERMASTPQVDELGMAYVAAGIVSASAMDDALHVAAATVARVDAIVSWNFKHIVRLDRSKAYNQVNLSLGYGMVTIVSPKEVRFDE